MLCNFLTCSTLGLSHVKAVDICFGSSGFKMMIATMRDEEFYEVRFICNSEVMFYKLG